ncbi:MAG: hypothetical protein J0H88_17520 [Sphingomonadales bacterium]|nr:hypothetical protein [Sphingomonadales bacterium]
MTRWIGLAAAFAATLAAAPAAAQYMPQEPQAPGYAAPNLRLPPRDERGDFVTPNRDLTGHEAFWNLKIALNVAAIGCRHAGSLQLISDYNDIIARHGGLIRTTEAAVIARTGVAARDKLSTRLFNYFAQPPAQREFCPVAGSIAQQIGGMDGATMMAKAPTMLADLDRPFVNFYHAYARYQVDLAAWRSGRSVQMAAANPERK